MNHFNLHTPNDKNPTSSIDHNQYFKDIKVFCTCVITKGIHIWNMNPS